MKAPPRVGFTYIQTFKNLLIGFIHVSSNLQKVSCWNVCLIVFAMYLNPCRTSTCLGGLAILVKNMNHGLSVFKCVVELFRNLEYVFESKSS